MPPSPLETTEARPAKNTANAAIESAAAASSASGTEQTIPQKNAEQGAAQTRELEKADVVPTLQIVDSKSENEPTSKPKPAEKEWTVAIDLAATLPSGAGAEHKLNELKKLARETKGKSVNFVVHAERLNDERGHLCADYKSQKADCMYGSFDKGLATTERYFIHDGKIEKLDDSANASPAEDMKELLQDAAATSPSKKLGLLVETHGGGAYGITSNVGASNLEETVAGIREGLKGSGHDKLDILDFDACDMGTAKVLAETRAVANDVVASAATEIANREQDGQNISASMRALLAHPEMNGRQFGDAIVQQAIDGKNGQGVISGTPTLANFDLSQYDNFTNSLDHFGAALNTVRPGYDFDEVQWDVTSASIPVTGLPEEKSHGRDLKGIAENIKHATEGGMLIDNSSPLAQAADDLLLATSKLVTSHYGDKALDYDKLGGLTISVPGSEVLSTEKIAHEISPFHRLVEKLQDVEMSGAKMYEQQSVVDQFNKAMMDVNPSVPLMANADFQVLLKERDAVAAAEDQAAFKTAINQMREDADRFDNSGTAKQIEKSLHDKAREEQLKYLAEPTDGLAPNWDAFIRRMQQQAK